MDKDATTGRTKPEKIGLASIQREGMDYEFDMLGEMSVPAHTFTVTKARAIFSELDGQVIHRPGVALGMQIGAWLEDGGAVADYQRPNTLPEAAAAELEKFAKAAGFSDQQFLAALVEARGVGRPAVVDRRRRRDEGQDPRQAQR